MSRRPELKPETGRPAPDAQGTGQVTGDVLRFFDMTVGYLLVADFTGVIRQINPTWTHELGYGTDELVGRPFLDLVHPDDRPATLAEMDKLRRGQQTFRFVNRYRSRGGTCRTLVWSAVSQPAEGLIYALAQDVTELNEANTALQTAHERLSLVLHGSNDGLWDWDVASGELYLSPRWHEILGYEPGEVEPHIRMLKDLSHPEDYPRIMALLDERLQGAHESRFAIECRLRDRRGAWRWLLARGEVTRRDEHGRAVRVSGTTTDIDQQKRMQETLVESEHRYRRLFEDAVLGIFRSTLDGRLIEANPAFAHMFGYAAPEELLRDVKHIGRELYAAPSDRDEIVRAVLAGEESAVKEVEYRRRNGERFFGTIHAWATTNERGEVAYLEGFVEDITARREAERALRERTEELDRRVRELNCLYAISRLIENTSLEEDALLAAILNEIPTGWPPSQAVTARLAIDGRAFQTPGHLPHQAKYRQDVTVFGEHVGDLEVHQRAGLDVASGPHADPRYHRLLGTIADQIGQALERVQSRKSLRRAHEELGKLARIVNNSPAVAFVWRNAPGWPVEYVTENVNQFGYTAEELVSGRMRFVDMVHPDDVTRLESEVSAHTAAGIEVYRQEYRLVTRAGDERWVDDRTWITRGPDGAATHYNGILLDITERKRAEAELAKHRDHLAELVRERTAALEATQAELLRQERLAALGQLIATVSHELRNPLGTVRTSVFSLGERLTDTEPAVQRAIARAERNILRCDRIIEELLDYTRTNRPELQTLRIDAWLADALAELDLPPTVQCTQRLATGATVRADPERLRRAVTNIVQNALHALEDPAAVGDNMGIETGVSEGRVLIRVVDRGPGMPAEQLEQVFEPLYSTRSFGVGLGLPIVRQIMEQHAGGVEIESEPGQGTTVTLWLPHADVASS